LGGPQASLAAKKTFLIVGGSDAIMLLGVILIWFKIGSIESGTIFSLPMDKINIPLGDGIAILAFFCLAIAAFAKAGVMPFHSWIPDCAEKAPIPVTAFLPASVDKLLGIYLLARICLNLFVMSSSMGIVLLFVGSFTIIAAVMMAIIQDDLKRLLSYCAISQVGYMVLGIGTGNPIGIAGGLFHMLNHAIYKSCLFLGGGAVESKTATTDLDKLGGLARFMPVTFLTFLIAALSVSGVPPFSGFVSKWMLYQGIIEVGKNGDKLWIIWLVAAMFGSALTLASFIKLIHATFLGQQRDERTIKDKKEVHWIMWLPMVILAGLCLLFGIFPYHIPLKNFIMPIVPGVVFVGFWQSDLATLLIIIGLIIGGIIYLLGRPRGVREDAPFMGGEFISEEDRVTGVDFYQNIKDMEPLKTVYHKAEMKIFDIYEQGKNLVLFLSGKIKEIHSGVLTVYISWILMGFIILILVMVR
jgi:formate hydrogenlyase subunit 3/multisubunit Na+/H+ antiporter MnhD subunit